jgi:hypothetical protein
MTGKKMKKKVAKKQQMSEYYFNFELVKQYPHVRSFIIKQPLKRSLGDMLTELLGGSKKGVYRV